MYFVKSIRELSWAVLSIATIGLAACSGGGSGSGAGTTQNPLAACDPNNAATFSECGNVLVAVTDAEGDFTSYTVDVLSISLERANGSLVETLPASARINFAELTELSELISAATLAPGDIVGGHIRIDYSNAEIFVEAGGDIVAADMVDIDGMPLGIEDLEIRLPDQDRLVITRGRTALLSVDFDLDASHTVDTAVSPPLVVAQPFIVAEVDPVDEKELRVRGALVDVDVAASSYEIRVRPWHHRAGDHGPVTVQTTDTTEYEINETMFVGQAGLEELATLPQGTLTVAFGTLDLSDRSFTAEIVHAGDSLGGGRYTAIYGNIVSRTGDQLTVKGAFAVRNDRAAHFHRTVIVDVGPNTGVRKVGDGNAVFDKDDLSVGQRIVAFGEISNPTVSTDPAAPDVALMLDATEGRVRMLVTRLHGSVNSMLPGELRMTLRGIDRLGVGMFNFAGTGGIPADDADPTDYQVATGTLPLDAIEIDRRVRVLGFVSPFGEAPPDFSGRTLIGPRDIPAVLGIGWTTSGTNAPFSRMDPDGVVLNLDNPDIGSRHHMLLGLRLVDLFDLPMSPTIEPNANRGLYGIWEPGHVELFNDFADFVDEMALRLGAADNARSFAAYGTYDEAGNLVTAKRVVVHMLPAN